VDFLVGFTIFILSLIMVANFVPSLLVGLQRTSGIDYNAVAYRTGVVLIEDPGQPSTWDNNTLLSKDIGSLSVSPILPPWDLQTKYQQEVYPSRFGLALTRDTPNILSINKIERFFNSSFSDPVNYFYNDSDYRNKLLFSSYQYGYNVTLQNISPMKSGELRLTKMLGEPYPAGYGYIRRYVVIKQNSNATINMDTFGLNQGMPYAFIANGSSENQVNLHFPGDPIPHQQFVIRFDDSVLYNESIDASMKIDLQREPLSIRITNLSSCLNNSAYNMIPAYLNPIANDSTQWTNTDPSYMSLFCTDLPGGVCRAPTNASLILVKFTDPVSGYDYTNFIPNVNLTVDGGMPGGFGRVDWEYYINNGVFPQPVPVSNTIDLNLPYIDPYYLHKGQSLDITFTFRNLLPHTLVQGTFLYDYNPLNVTQPVLSTGMLEVGIW
jgi:hypothetical protein